MIIILLTIIVLLSAFVLYLNVDFYQQKKMFRIKIESLEQIILLIKEQQEKGVEQLKISDEFDERFKAKKEVIGRNIFDLNLHLFDLLSKNDLLGK